MQETESDTTTLFRGARLRAWLGGLIKGRRWGGFSASILTNTAYLGAARIAQLAVGFTVGVSVARYLGPADSGALAYAISFAALFSSAAALGLDSIVIRDLAAANDQNNAAAEEILSAAFVLRLLASPATLLVIAAASMIANKDTHTRLLVLIVASGVIFQPVLIADLYFQSRVQSKYVVYAQIMALIVVSLARIILIELKAPLLVFAIVTVAETALFMFGLAYIYKKHRGHLPRMRANRLVARRLLREAWPLALTGVLTSVYINVDRVLIKQLLGNVSAGKYAVVVTIATALYFVPIAFGQSLFPSLVEARSDAALYHRRLQQAFDTLLWAAVAVALPITIVAEPLMQRLYGTAYSGSGSALAILIWSAVATFLGLVTSYWLIAENLQRLYPIRIFASLCTCVALNLVLIPRWGIRGAAVATVTAQFVSSTVVYAFRPRTRLMVTMQLRALALPFRLWTEWTSERSR